MNIGYFILSWIITLGSFYLVNKAINAYTHGVDSRELMALTSMDFMSNKEKFDTFLTQYVTDCLQDYALYNIIPDSGLSYINKERENKIRDDLVLIVAKRLSPLIKKKIGTYYSDNYLGEVLAEKVFFAVTIYVTNFNTEKEKTKLPKKKEKREPDPITEFESDW